MAMILSIGLTLGVNHETYLWIVDWIITPIEAIMGAMVIFWIAQAAFRAFRIQSWEGALIAVCCFLVLLGNTPVVNYLSPEISAIANWLSIDINKSVARGLWLGIGLGSVVLGIRVILGLERGYLGGEG
jgi:hypothetical protein